MRKKHDYEALLKYVRMLEEGYSIMHICKMFGIGRERLESLWLLYQPLHSICLNKLLQDSTCVLLTVVLSLLEVCVS